MVNIETIVKIDELIPISSGSGSFLTELEVVFELSNGFKITSYDHNFLLTNEVKVNDSKEIGHLPAYELVNKTKKVKLHICCPYVKKIASEERKIVQTNYYSTHVIYKKDGKNISSVNPTSSPDCYSFYGKVLDISMKSSGKQQSLIIDIGVGSIEVGLDRAGYEYEKFQIGDFIETISGWIELDEMMN